MTCESCIYYKDHEQGSEVCLQLAEGTCPEVLAILAYEEKN